MIIILKLVNMKKLLFFACLMFALASCEKDPDMSELDTDLTVYTDYDSSADFGSYKTYFLPDSILEAGGHKATYWKDENAMKIIKAVESQMNERGYTRLTDPEDKDNADWGPWWGGWYYPYPVTYTYSTNTLVMEMVDLTGDTDGKNIPVLWYANASGAQYSGMYNLQLLVNSVQQAFKQSEYIQCNK